MWTVVSVSFRRRIAVPLAVVFGAFQVACGAATQVAEVPFTMVDSHHMLIEVHVNDAPAPLTFVFDTGAAASALDTGVAARLGVEATGDQDATGAAGTAKHRLATGQRLRVAADVVLGDVALVLVDLGDLSAGLGRPLEGIVGNDLLQRYLTAIDFSGSRLRLYEFGDGPPTDGYQAIPFTFDRGIPIPQFQVSLALADGEWLAGQVFFDSGAAGTLIVNQPFAAEHRVEARAGRTIERRSRTLTAEMVLRTAAAKALRVGTAEWRDVPFEIATSKTGVTAFAGYLGILGNDVIRRFDWIVDYRQKELFCRRNAGFATAYDRPIAGASVERRDGGIVVVAVVTDSPAATAGLRQGDRIVAIAGAAVDSEQQPPGADLAEVRRYLEREDAAIEVTVLRGEKRVNLAWKSRRLL